MTGFFQEKRNKKTMMLLAWIGLFFINVIIVYSIHFKLIASTCMTVAQVQNDSRCLYILSNKVYNKGSKSSPHHSHPCGTDVTAIIPSFHTDGPAMYLTPNYVADICAATPSPQPTSPQPTLPPTSSTFYALTVVLHGIGIGGDNANPNSGGNESPQNPSRQVTISVYNASNQLVTTKTGTVIYAPDTKNFLGTILMGDLPSGQYINKIKTSGFLTKQAGSFQVINAGQTNTIPSVIEVSGDIDNDNKLDILDYNILVSCFGPKRDTPTCTQKTTADLNDDGQINGIDYNIFIRELSVQTSQ